MSTPAASTAASAARSAQLRAAGVAVETAAAAAMTEAPAAFRRVSVTGWLLRAAAVSGTAAFLYVASWVYKGKTHNPTNSVFMIENAPDVAAEDVAALLKEAERLRAAAITYAVPGNKQGTTLPYSKVIELSPHVVDFYKRTAATVSAQLGMTVYPTPEEDKSSCSILYYERKGDHIDWHYDLDFYAGRHFTVLVPLQSHDCTAQLQIRDKDGAIRNIASPPGRMIIFEGAETFHRVTPMLTDTESRTVLSMTYCTDPTNTPLMELARLVKDGAFFGPVGTLLY